MNLLRDLKQLKIQNKVVSIFTNEEDIDLFSCGYIAGIDTDFIFLNHISPNGTEDGIISRKIDEIFKIEYNGEYENRLERLYKIKKQSHKDYLVKNETVNRDLLNTLFENALRLKLVTTIAIGDTFNNDEITGLIKKTDNKKVYITQISFTGQKSGESIVLLDNIYRVSCDTQDEKDILLLYENTQAGFDC